MSPKGQSRASTATRERILLTATEVFAKVGYRNASLRDIAAKTNLTHPALIYHFNTKAQLLAAVLERRDAIDLEHFRSSDFDATRPPGELLVATVAYNQTQPGLVELFTTLTAEATDPEHPAHEWLKARYDAIHSLARDIWTTPDSTPDEVEAEVTLIIALMDGLQIQWLLYPDSVDMTHLLRIYLEKIGLVGKAGAPSERYAARDEAVTSGS